jgi:hypothetical protein
MHINLIIYIRSGRYYICIFTVKKVIIYFNYYTSIIELMSIGHKRNLLI